MNLFPARVRGGEVRIGDRVVYLRQDHGTPQGDVQLGVRPEFVRLTGDVQGLPVTVRRVEDVGRHRIVRAVHDAGDGVAREVNAILNEGETLPEGARYLHFVADRMSVYADGWRVEPKDAA